MITINTPFEEGLDEIFDNYGMIGQLLSSNSAKTRDRDWLKAALTQLHEAAVREARLDEISHCCGVCGWWHNPSGNKGISQTFEERKQQLKREGKQL